MRQRREQALSVRMLRTVSVALAALTAGSVLTVAPSPAERGQQSLAVLRRLASLGVPVCDAAEPTGADTETAKPTRRPRECEGRLNGVDYRGQPEYIPEIDQPITRMMSETGTPGVAFAVSYKGRLIWTRGYGYAVLPDAARGTEGEFMSATTPQQICSISKPLTAVAVLSLADKGVLSLDSPFISYVGLTPLAEDDRQFTERKQAITLRHLLTHASSLGGCSTSPSFWLPLGRRLEAQGKVQLANGYLSDVDAYRYYLTAIEGLPVGGMKPPAGPPGSEFQYNGMNFDLLTLAVEKGAERLLGRRVSYPEYVLQYVLKPLGITTAKTSAEVTDAASVRAFFGTHSYVFSERKGAFEPATTLGEWDRAGYPYCRFALGAGGWWMSAVDLLRFTVGWPTLIRNKPLVREMLSLQRVSAPKPEDWPMGLGWRVGQEGYLPGIGRLAGWGHGGTAFGLNTSTSCDLVHGWADVVYVNGRYSSEAYPLGVFNFVHSVLFIKDSRPMGIAAQMAASGALSRYADQSGNY